MNKRGLIKFIFVFITFIISMTIVTSPWYGFGSIFNPVFLADIIIALSIFMYSNKKNVKKYNFIYNVFNLLFIVVSFVFIAYYIYSSFDCFFDSSCSMELTTQSAIFYPMFLLLITLFSFKDLFKKTNKTNDLLIILTSSIIILAHIRYYIEPNLLGDSQYKYNFLLQGYVYFNIMYILLLIHYKLNKQES
jgi:hypothetical protein